MIRVFVSIGPNEAKYFAHSKLDGKFTAKLITTNNADIETIRDQSLVFIIDEVHLSSFGDMLIVPKRTFSSALFLDLLIRRFRIKIKKDNTTSTVFGNMLHHYSIVDDIRDGNVLGFDP